MYDSPIVYIYKLSIFNIKKFKSIFYIENENKTWHLSY